MSNVDNDNETNGVGRLESGYDDGIDCARSGRRVGVLRRGAPEEHVDVERRKKSGRWCSSIVAQCDNHDNGRGDVVRRVPHAARGGEPGCASGLGISKACSASST